MKRCTKCFIEKDESEFHKRQSRCKVCMKEASHKYYEEHKDKINAQTAAYKKTPKGKIIAGIANQKYRDTPEGRKLLHISQRKYRLKIKEQYDRDQEWYNEQVALINAVAGFKIP